MRCTFRPYPAGVRQEGRHAPHAHSPSLRSSGTPSCLPVSGRKCSDSAFSSAPTSCRWGRRGAQSRGSRPRQRGPPAVAERAHGDHSLGAAGARAARARPSAPPTPGRAHQLRSRDLRGPGPALSASRSPHMLTWLGRPGSLPWPEGLWRLRPRDGRGWG